MDLHNRCDPKVLSMAIIVRAVRKSGRRRAEKRRLKALSEGRDDTGPEIERGLLGKVGVLSHEISDREM